MNILTESVLVLNRHWQAIGVTDVQTAITDCAKGTRTAIDTESMMPLRWDDWVKLGVRESDKAISTTNRKVRVPTVVVACNYDGMPKSRPRLDRRGIAKRDGKRCAYTGDFCPDGTLDHVMPRSRGGEDSWTNLVWSRKDVNHKKGNRTPTEAGLRLLIKPVEPKELPMSVQIEPRHPDWKMFLVT